ncbi:unnamed protein product [Schistosoma rodhaini]|nr:unnamed protein product [Schistosoma rodhaini]
MDDDKGVTSNSRLVLPHSKPSFRVNHEDRLMLADSFLSPDAHPAAVRKLRGRRRRGKQNLLNCCKSVFQVLLGCFNVFYSLSN